MVKDIHTTGSSYPRKLTNVNGTLFFIASDLQNVDQLWKSDGSLNGTIPVKRLSNDFGFPVGQPQMISFKNKLHYLYTSDSELQLWQSDGSLDGTLPVKVLSYGGDFLVNFNNRQLLFTGPQGWFGSTLWQSDGTSEGTSTIQTINGEKLAFISQPVVLNDNSYFYGFSSNGIIGLWKYDGVNLQLIKHPLQSYHSMYYNGKVPIIDNVLYFRAFSTDNRNNLWRSDATENGTFAIPVVNEGIIYEDVQEITALRNKIYFTARSVQLEKRFLFVSDGTEAGTKRLFEVPYQRHEERSNVILGAYDGTLYLRLRDSAHGLELWKYTPDEKKCLPVVVSKIK
ncbi:hypothetical protein AWR27_02815 [Spirosoma montaniterrae]|uniref:Hyalin n=2 Tax=Spirosoma montaniterrae TaxID=1178516 RepID=A0A1P9WSM8_9BACT|nr:hypothetical protein AWR27_02815 [Spirosoma montaniterrae]